MDHGLNREQQDDMPDKLIDWWAALTYVLALITGFSGGCVVAAHQVLRGRNVTLLFIAAYATVGTFSGVILYTAMVAFTVMQATFENALIVAGIGGVVTTMAVAGINITARFVAPKLGVEAEINIRPTRDRSGKAP